MIGAISSLLGGNKMKNLLGKALEIKNDRQADTSNPGHTHGSKEKRNAAEAQRSNSESVDIGSVSNLGSFMGKGQVDKFSSFIDPSSIDRSGRAAPRPDDSISLDPVGIKPAMNPPMAVPVPPNVDNQGVQSLYSEGMAKTDPELNLKDPDTIYKKNGIDIGKKKFDYNNKFNDSLIDRSKNINDAFPVESTDMGMLLYAKKMANETLDQIKSGSYTKEVDGKTVSTRNIKRN